MRKLLLLIIISISVNIDAQYITLDRDGYTNVRTEPNAKSEIAETVKKYQVFYSAADIPCSDEADGRNDFGNWLRITTDMQSVAGYIYTKNIYALEDLPVLATETRLESDLFHCSNDSIDVRISLQPYNEKNELKNKRAYGTDGFKPEKEIKEIKINYGNKTVTLPESKFRNFYNVGYVSVWLGLYGELYILISGGDASSGYSIMLSVVGDDILFALPREC